MKTFPVKPTVGGKPASAQTGGIEASLQLGYLNSDGSQNTNSSPAGNNVPNLAQIVVLNYMALHSANAIAQWPTLYPSPNLNNGLGSGTALEPLVMWQPLAGLVNGTVA